MAQSLNEGRERVSQMIASADKRAQLITNQAKEAAQVEANKILETARLEIAQATSRAREKLREEVAQLAIAGAEKILRREINADNHMDILNSLKQEL